MKYKFYEDPYLLQLTSCKYKQQRPWWHFGLTVFCVGFIVLAVLAWTVAR